MNNDWFQEGLNSAQREPGPIDLILKNPTRWALALNWISSSFFGHLHHHCSWRPWFRLDTRGSQAPVFYRSFFPLRLRTCIKKNCLQMGLVSDRSVQIQVQTLWNKFTIIWNVMYFCPAQCTQLHFRRFGSVAIHCSVNITKKLFHKDKYEICLFTSCLPVSHVC